MVDGYPDALQLRNETHMGADASTYEPVSMLGAVKRRHTVVVLKETVWNTNQPSFLVGNPDIIWEYAV